MNLKELDEKIGLQYLELLESLRNTNFDLSRLNYVYREYNQLISKIYIVQEKMEERQFLTELHITALPLQITPYSSYFKECALPLKAHEKYHEVGEEIKQLTRDFFRDAKTFLNDFTFLYSTLIPQKNMRNINFASFGKCVNSVEKHLVKLGVREQEVLAPFFQKGKIIDGSVCKYRDKFIEHSKTLNYPELLTGKGQIQLVHENLRAGKGKNVSMLIPRTQEEEYAAEHSFIPITDMLFLHDKNEKTWGYIHVLPVHLSSYSMEENEYKVHHAHDSTVLHFKKYGVHLHIFPPQEQVLPPQNQEDDSLFYKLKTPILGKSPEASYSMDMIAEFLSDGLQCLQKYLE